MRKFLSFTLCLVFFLASMSAASNILQDETIFAMKQAAANIEAALHSKNFTNTKSAVSSALSSLETFLKHNSCPWVVAIFIDQLSSIPYKIQYETYGILDVLTTQFTLDSTNRDCFPLVNLGRKFINGVAKAIGISQELIPKFRGNKIVSFDVDAKTTVGRTVLIIEDAVRFTECAYAIGALGMYTALLFDLPSPDARLFYLEALLGFQMVEGCKEAVSLAQELMA